MSDYGIKWNGNISVGRKKLNQKRNTKHTVCVTFKDICGSWQCAS